MRAVCLVAILSVSGPAFAEDAVPLRDALLARGGKTAVYLAHGEGGLVAAAADGSWSQPLVEGAVAAAALDAAQDLVWMVRGDRLEVLDLREPEPKPIAIVSRWYTRTDTFVSRPVVAVTGVSTASTDSSHAGVHPTLSWKARPRIATAEGGYGGIWEDQDAVVKKAIRKAKIVGGDWLTSQLGRKPARRAAAPRAEGKTTSVALPEGMGDCEDEDLCGEARPFGPTGWLLVTALHRCGDACHTGCVLHDRKSKRFASPTEPGIWGKSAKAGPCDGYLFDATGKTYVIDEHVCTRSGCAAAAGGGTGFAWL